MQRIAVMGAGAALAEGLLSELGISGAEVFASYRDTIPSKDCTIGRVFTAGNIDLRTREQTKYFFEWVKTLRPKLNGLVTVVGAAIDGKIEDLSKDQFDTSVNNNLGTVFNCLRYASPMLEDGSNVVVVGSIVGSMGGRGCSSYAAGKAGLVGLVRSVALEWASRDICVNLLELGYINAGMGARLPDKLKSRINATIPLGKFGSEWDFVEAVKFLLKTRYMTGNVLTLAGGLR